MLFDLKINMVALNQTAKESPLTNTVFIPCAGKGSRIANGNSNFPKPLRDLGGLPAIARVMSQYPEDWAIVIALGFEATIIRDAVEALIFGTPRQGRVEFVSTNSWSEESQGLSHTLLAAKEVLGNRPFVFHAVDSILDESAFSVPEALISGNQVFLSKCSTPGTYRHLTSWSGASTPIWAVSDFQAFQDDLAYTGLAHVYEPDAFWTLLFQGADGNPEAGETLGIDLANVKLVKLPDGAWFDIGSRLGLAAAEDAFLSARNILTKKDEAIWFSGSRVIKIHSDRNFIEGRVERADKLSPYVPEIHFSNSHTFSYDEVSGLELSKVLEEPGMGLSSFFDFLWDFWTGDQLGNLEKTETPIAAYMTFYREKTFSRVADLIRRFPHLEKECWINGTKARSLSDLCDSIPWEALATITPGRVHGDLHPENILAVDGGGFVLLDWRQDMAGSRGSLGDVYYDLGKMAHGLRVDHGMVKLDRYSVSEGDNGEVAVSIIWPDGKRRAFSAFRDQVNSWGLSWNQVMLIEAVIYLNIAPLHEPDEYAKFLAYFGRLNAEIALDSITNKSP
jgi:hypothetical protein